MILNSPVNMYTAQSHFTLKVDFQTIGKTICFFTASYTLHIAFVFRSLMGLIVSAMVLYCSVFL